MEENVRKTASVDKAMTLLECFMEARKPMSLAELSESTGMPKSSIHGLLNTMRVRKMVRQIGRNGKYWLGSLALELGRLAEEYAERTEGDGEE